MADPEWAQALEEAANEMLAGLDAHNPAPADDAFQEEDDPDWDPLFQPKEPDKAPENQVVPLPSLGGTPAPTKVENAGPDDLRFLVSAGISAIDAALGDIEKMEADEDEDGDDEAEDEYESNRVEAT